MVTGPAASVLSTGPRGWQTGPCTTPQCVNPAFTPTVNYQTGTVEFNRHFNTGSGGQRKGGHHKPGNGGSYYGGYGYAYPVYVPVPVEPEPVEEEPEQPALTVFENRPQVRLAPNPTPMEEAPYAEPTAPRQPARTQNFTGGHHEMSPVTDEQIPVVIVFKDGHEQEVKNYAIVGDTLYDLGTFVAHKIKLADLDLKQTIKKNEDRGVEFNLPASLRPVG